MKKPDAFEHKRKVRDKANLRLLKHRYLVTPSFVVLAFMGGTVGGTIAGSFSANAIAFGFFAGMLGAVAGGGSYIIRNLSK